jgi:hypothetical protein
MLPVNELNGYTALGELTLDGYCHHRRTASNGSDQHPGSPD